MRTEMGESAYSFCKEQKINIFGLPIATDYGVMATEVIQISW